MRPRVIRHISYHMPRPPPSPPLSLCLCLCLRDLYSKIFPNSRDVGKHRSMLYIRVHSPTSSGVRNSLKLRAELWKPNKFRGGAFPLRNGSASHAGRGFRATTRYYATRIDITGNFHFAKHSRPTSFLGDSFTCNSLEADAS